MLAFDFLILAQENPQAEVVVVTDTAYRAYYHAACMVETGWWREFVGRTELARPGEFTECLCCVTAQRTRAAELVRP